MDDGANDESTSRRHQKLADAYNRVTKSYKTAIIDSLVELTG
jgi:hypothetical protein